MGETEPQKSQLSRFQETARQLEADEDEVRWEEKLRKVARAKPAPLAPRSEPEQ